MQEVGRCVQTVYILPLLYSDMGRVLFLQERGYEAALVYYVDRAVTPENCMLIATPKPHECEMSSVLS